MTKNTEKLSVQTICITEKEIKLKIINKTCLNASKIDSEKKV